MMMKVVTCVVVALSLQSASSFLVGTAGPRTFAIKSRANVGIQTQLCMTGGVNLDRRSILSIFPAAIAFSALSPALAADGKSKIVVFGGSGYVGAHVVQILSQKGYDVVSVSRSSPSAQAEKVSKILGSPLAATKYESLDASTADLNGVLSGASAVVSCVGIAPGGSNQRAGNGGVNIRIADAAKAAGVERFVYISVSSALANGPAKFLLGDYLKGKAEAEAAVIKDFGSNALVIKPAIIAGGPPGELRPPGPPGIKPVSVDAVAKAVVAGALGEKSGSIDGNDDISAF
eukprot:CAMPEP_0198305870 /NCGR_PEP_ID=MMETSP1449-20131203/58110_1 /TAXON_ID=420275 /ORGANISM="Attheya septentrionalis, Strain CCMP2084" /LENGTH=288 /DNA_ID=CAMNT_0044008413 /DNA_START=139 /DNA_END=1005 /DNA_ORIENTATION=+